MSLSLERIEISGVRSVGWSIGGLPGLVLDGLGGVNIVAAPNGVGKTSVIEALTLALTGEPRRLGQTVPLQAVTHNPRESARARVLLRFSEGKQLQWEEPDEKSKDDRLRALQSRTAQLLSKGALAPSVVSNLLRLTHLLPQGWGERFTDQKGSHRWTLVERALDLEGFRAAVQEGKNRGSIKLALEKAVADTAKAADDAAAARDRWAMCVANLLRAREGARGAGARSPADLKAELHAISTELGLQPGATPLRLRQVISERRAALALGVEIAESLALRGQEAEAQVAGAEAALAIAESTLREADSASQQARAVLAQAESTAAVASLPALRTVRDQAAAVERACTILAQVAILVEAGSAFRDAEARLSEMPEATVLDQLVVVAEAELQAARVELNVARGHLEKLERDQNEMGRLLRELRPHIADGTCDSRECPVCGTRLPTKELLERLDDRLGMFGNAATEVARQRTVQAEVQLDELATKARAANDQRDTANAMRRLRNQHFETIAKVHASYPALAADGSPDGSLLAEALQAEVAKLVPEGSKLADVTLQQAHLATEASERAVLAAEEAVRASEAFGPPGAETPTIDVARHRRDLAEKTFHAAVEQRAVAAQRLAMAHSASKSLAVERSRIAFPDLVDTPFEQLPAKLASTRHTQTLTLDNLEARLGAAEKSAEVYSRLEAVRLAEDAIRSEARSFGEELSTDLNETLLDAVETRLRERMEEARNEATRVTSGASTVRGWVKSLSEELQHYEDECLKEMDPIVERFRDALAPTMRWRMTLRKYKSEAKPGFANEGAPDVDPFDLLSEGEHTAVALAYLFAFHSRFQWSRWPALVLDDPFQATDVVRAGALLDVLQGLNMQCGTQILLTTHDPQLAEWAKRKMTRAGVDAHLFELERAAEGIRARRT